MRHASNRVPVRTLLHALRLEDRNNPVHVRFDYSLDTSGFFNSQDRRDALDRVAASITSTLTDSLAPVAPSGGNTWQEKVYDATIGGTRTIDNPTVGQDELVVYVTAGPVGGSELALTSGGAYSATGSQDWLNTVRNRGQAGADAGADFGPWGGLIAFNSTSNWNFTTDLPKANQYDFTSVATHELLHAFGFGLQTPSFTRYATNGAFTGPNAEAVYGGAVPLDGSDTDHVAQGVRYNGQESVMAPAIAIGKRKTISALELGVLKDIGWSTTAATVAPPVAVPVAAPASPPVTSTSAVVPNATVASGTARFAVGSGGDDGTLTVYGAAGQVLFTSAPFGGGSGGLRVATGDVTGDGVDDYVAGTGPGVAPRVVVIDGGTGGTIRTLAPFEDGFRGGVYVAAADVSGDGRADVIVGAGAGGGPRVKVYDGATGNQLADFWGIEDLGFRGGVRVAAGDIDGDGKADLVAAAGEGGGPRVAAYGGGTLRNGYAPGRLFGDFSAFEPTLRNGAYVAVGDFNGDGHADIAAAAGETGAPRVTVFDGAALLRGDYGTWQANFFSGSTSFVGGARVAAADLDADGRADLIVGCGTGSDGAVRVYPGKSLTAAATPALSGALTSGTWALDGAFVG